MLILLKSLLIIDRNISSIDSAYEFDNITFSSIPSIPVYFNMAYIEIDVKIPVAWDMLRACMRADHTFKDVQGNVGLLACLVQIFFQTKPSLLNMLAIGIQKPNNLSINYRSGYCRIRF